MITFSLQFHLFQELLIETTTNISTTSHDVLL